MQYFKYIFILPYSQGTQQLHALAGESVCLRFDSDTPFPGFHFFRRSSPRGQTCKERMPGGSRPTPWPGKACASASATAYTSHGLYFFRYSAPWGQTCKGRMPGGSRPTPWPREMYASASATAYTSPGLYFFRYSAPRSQTCKGRMPGGSRPTLKYFEQKNKASVKDTSLFGPYIDNEIPRLHLQVITQLAD